jgi:hypothetical protein
VPTLNLPRPQLLRSLPELGFTPAGDPIVGAHPVPTRSGRGWTLHYRCPFCERPHERLTGWLGRQVAAHCYTMSPPLAVALVPMRLSWERVE